MVEYVFIKIEKGRKMILTDKNVQEIKCYANYDLKDRRQQL